MDNQEIKYRHFVDLEKYRRDGYKCVNIKCPEKDDDGIYPLAVLQKDDDILNFVIPASIFFRLRMVVYGNKKDASIEEKLDYLYGGFLIVYRGYITNPPEQ